MKRLICILLLFSGVAQAQDQAQPQEPPKTPTQSSTLVNEPPPIKSDSTSVNKIQLSHERSFTRANFTLGTSVAQLKGKNASAMAIGPRGGFEYGLTEKFALGANMAFTFQGNGAGAGAFFYSGLSALFKYAVVGSSVKVGSTIYQKDGTLVYLSKPVAKRRIALQAGLEQLFLNGATSIYPAIGPTIGVSTAFGFRGYSIEFDLMSSSLLANDNALSMVQVGANINLDM